MTLVELEKMALSISPDTGYDVQYCGGKQADWHIVNGKNMPTEPVFRVNNEICAWKGEDGNMCVIPYWDEVGKILTASGFTQVKSGFDVPLSLGETPLWAKEKWNTLLTHAKVKKQEEFAQTCKDFAIKAGLGELSDEILAKCMAVPFSGIELCTQGKMQEYIHRVCYSEELHTLVKCCRIGKYNFNDTVVIFFYNGSTYISPCVEEVCKALNEANYFPNKDWSLPLNCTTYIKDDFLRTQWENLLISSF